MTDADDKLGEPLKLPCGVVLRNRIAKSAMSDSLGDGCGNPTAAQIRLYERWAEGGLAVSIIGEVQGNPGVAEKPGNLVLTEDAATAMFEDLAQREGPKAPISGCSSAMLAPWLTRRSRRPRDPVRSIFPVFNAQR